MKKYFTNQTNKYPIVLIPDGLIKVLKRDIFLSEVSEELELEYPHCDLNIYECGFLMNYFYDHYEYSLGDRTPPPSYEDITFWPPKLKNPTIPHLRSYIKKTVSLDKYLANSDSMSHYYMGIVKLPIVPDGFETVTKYRLNYKFITPIVIIYIAIFSYLIFQINFFYAFLSIILIPLLFYSISFINKISYEESVKIPKDEYDTKIKELKNKLEAIEGKIKQDYKIEKEKIDEIIFKNIDQALLTLRKKHSKYGGTFIEFNREHKRGRTEVFFLSHLHQKFGDQIKIDISPDGGHKGYFPDFLLISKELGFHIDIEIDEPYSSLEGTPIHHDRTTDRERDDYFLNLNWGVIRFSEEQIIKQPVCCCDLIYNVIVAIMDGNEFYVDNVHQHNKWTYEESLIMLNQNYRNTYLPYELKIRKNNF